MAVDTLTSLRDFYAFRDDAAQLLGANPDTCYMLCRVNLLDFRLYNRMYGLSGGDQLLRAFAAALAEEFSSEAQQVLLSRVGVDHFLIFGAESLLGDKASVYSRVKSRLEKLVPGFFLDAHIGFSRIKGADADVSRCSEEALEALSTLRKGQEEHCAAFDAEMQSHSAEESFILSNMRQALAEGRLLPYFQPQYDYYTGYIFGLEALVRWVDPKKGIIPPSVFLPLFEKSGFIYEMDQSIWQQSCAWLKKWRAMGLNIHHISVNISRFDFCFTDLEEKLAGIIAANGLSLKDVHIEITESVLVEKTERFDRIMRSLHEQGYIIEMDDFGSGYSSMNMLKDMPFDVLKLDTNLQQDNDRTGRAGNILSSMVRLSNQLGMPVIAEGVEQPSQAEFLKSVGCRYMQGYLFSKPLPAEEVEGLLKKNAPVHINLMDQEDYTSRFLDMRTLEALVFNSFVNGACILCLQNSNARVLRANDAFFQEMNVSRELVWGKAGNILDVFRPEDREFLLGVMQKSKKTGKEQEFDIDIQRTTSQAVLWLHFHVRYLNSKLDSDYYYISVENITERKSLEVQTQTLATKLKTLLDGLPGSVARYSKKDGQLYCEYMTERHAAARGYTPEELLHIYNDLGKTIIHPDDEKEAREALEQMFRDGKPFLKKYRAINRDGSIAWIRCETAFDPINQHIIAFYSDITAEQRTRELLANSEKELLALTDTETLCTLTAELLPEGKQLVVSMSQGLTTMFGYEEREVKASYHADPYFFVYPPDRERLEENLKNADEGGRLPVVEYRSICGNGQLIWVSRRGLIVEKDEHRYVMFVYTNMSSTYRLYEYILNLADTAVVITDLDRHEVVYANRAAKQLFANGEELLGRPCYSLWGSKAVCESCKAGDCLEDENEDKEFGGRTYRIHRTRMAWNGIKTIASFITDKTAQSILDREHIMEFSAIGQAMSKLYPLGIYCNLTKNTYRMLEYDNFTNHTASWNGTFDELIGYGLSTIPDPEDKRRFEESFSRQSMIRTWESGKEDITLDHRQLDDRGNTRWIRTTGVRIHEKGSDDLVHITVARPLDQDTLPSELLYKQVEADKRGENELKARSRLSGTEQK